MSLVEVCTRFTKTVDISGLLWQCLTPSLEQLVLRLSEITVAKCWFSFHVRHHISSCSQELDRFERFYVPIYLFATHSIGEFSRFAQISKKKVPIYLFAAHSFYEFIARLRFYKNFTTFSLSVSSVANFVTTRTSEHSWKCSCSLFHQTDTTMTYGWCHDAATSYRYCMIYCSSACLIIM